MKVYPFKVSVRLMTYMQESYIKDTMDSIMMQQTNFPVQVVVGDDFSTDNTLQIIKSYKDSENIKIHILNRKYKDEYWQKRQKLGRLYNFLNIIENCTGEYIALLDGDDYWTDPLKLQKQADFLDENPKVVLSYHHFKNKFSKYAEGSLNYYEPINKPLLKSRTLTVMFRNIIGNYPKSLLKAPNGDQTFKFYLSQFGEFKSIDNVKPSIRLIHNDGVMSNQNIETRLNRGLKTMLVIFKTFCNTKYAALVKKRIYHFRYKINWLKFSRTYNPIFLFKSIKFLFLKTLLKYKIRFLKLNSV